MMIVIHAVKLSPLSSSTMLAIISILNFFSQFILFIMQVQFDIKLSILIS